MDDLELIKVVNEKIKLNENIDENLKALINLNNLQELFIRSCRNGYKETAMWLYELSKTDGNIKININSDDDYAFRRSCSKGHKKTALWLCSLDPKYKFTINENNQIVYIIIADNNDDIDKYAFEYNIQMLLLKDGYLKINNTNKAHNERKRFYQIIGKLPLDLTQKMSYTLCGSTKTIIKSATFNRLLNHKL